MTDEELKELVAGLAVSNIKKEKDLDNLFEEISILQAENAIAQKENSIQFKKTEELFKNMGIHIGGMANSHGLSTEEYFYNSLVDNPRLGNIRFDEIIKNIHGKVARLEVEFDIAMYNGINVGLIECKYKAKEEDVIKLIEKKVGNFKQLFPFYANHTFYLGIASFSFDARIENFAKQNGVAILRQKGDIMEIDADNLKAY
jgi:hypothetical protein